MFFFNPVLISVIWCFLLLSAFPPFPEGSAPLQQYLTKIKKHFALFFMQKLVPKKIHGKTVMRALVFAQVVDGRRGYRGYFSRFCNTCQFCRFSPNFPWFSQVVLAFPDVDWCGICDRVRFLLKRKLNFSEFSRTKPFAIPFADAPWNFQFSGIFLSVRAKISCNFCFLFLFSLFCFVYFRRSCIDTVS